MDSKHLTFGMPSLLSKFVQDRVAGESTPITLDSILPGESYAAQRNELLTRGATVVRDLNGEVLMTGSFDNSGKLMSIAAAVPRKSGSAVDFLNNIDDFNELNNLSNADRKSRVALYNRIYRVDGISNNAVSKLAALIAPKGQYKVKGVRGQRGRNNSDTKIRLDTILNWWKDKVNSNAVDAVMTGSRGVQTFVRRGARLSLVEGDHFGRRLWTNVEVPRLGSFSLPMNLQSFSSQYIDPIDGIEFTDLEAYYWKPPAKFITQLQSPTDPNLDKILKKYVNSKVRAALIKDQKYLLDPLLMFHIKNQGMDTEMFGESMIAPALSAVRYTRALDALEMTVITNIMARVVIIKVGSDNEKSVYHKVNVSQTRLGTLQRAMQGAGPHATILWGGPDIDVVEVSAHNALLDLVPRYAMAERRQLMAMGIPTVLMIGEGSGGKAVGYAAALAAVSRAKELQDQYKQLLTSIGEEIAIENGFLDVDIVWEWEENLLDDREAAANLLIKMYQLGLTTAETTLANLNFDYDAELERQEQEVADGIKDEVFGAPRGAMTSNVNGLNPDNTSGRPANTGNPDPRKNKETKSPTPNK
jgi:hypothetical protein